MFLLYLIILLDHILTCIKEITCKCLTLITEIIYLSINKCIIVVLFLKMRE